MVEVSVLAQNASGAPAPALGLLVDVVAYGELNQSSGWLVPLFVLAYSLGRHADTRRLALGLAVIVPVFTINALYSTDGFVNELAFDLLVGNGSRHRRRRAAPSLGPGVRAALAAR